MKNIMLVILLGSAHTAVHSMDEASSTYKRFLRFAVRDVDCVFYTPRYQNQLVALHKEDFSNTVVFHAITPTGKHTYITSRADHKNKTIRHLQKYGLIMQSSLVIYNNNESRADEVAQHFVDWSKIPTSVCVTSVPKGPLYLKVSENDQESYIGNPDDHIYFFDDSVVDKFSEAA